MPMGIAIGYGIGLGGGVRPVVYLLRDEFTTAEAAPITSPRDAEPGPGTLLVTETTDDYTFISDGKLQFSGGGSNTSYNDPMVSGDALARVAGRTFRLQLTNLQSGTYYPAGFSPNAASWGASGGFRFSATRDIRLMDAGWPSSGAIPQLAGNGAWDASTVIDIAVVLRAQGFFGLARLDGGDWKLLYPAFQFDTDPVYPAVAAYNDVLESAFWRVADLPSPWDDDAGMASDEVAGAFSGGETFTHPADGRIEFTVDTRPVGAVIRVHVRQQDANNLWRIEIGSTGTISLYELVSGTPTLRDSAAGSVSNGDRITVLCDDETISVNVAGTATLNYASAANFKDETDGEVNTLGAGGAASDLVTYPLDADAAAYPLVADWLPGQRALNDTFTHEADCVLEFVLDALPGAGTVVDVAFRMQDGSNFWRVRFNNSGDMILDEVAGGPPTGRGTAAGVVSGGERIVIVCDDETISGFYDNTKAWGYASAATYKTETSGKITNLGTGGEVSNIVTWPRTLSGAALSALEAI